MSKKVRGNKEAKKPRQSAPAVPPPVTTGSPPALTGGHKPQPGKR